MEYPKVRIRNKKKASILRRHPWVFSGAVIDKELCKDGDLAYLIDEKDNFLALGYFQDGSIMFRILSFDPIQINQEFWDKAIGDAKKLRADISLPNKETNAFRLIHAEGDHLPGLIIDLYDDVAVIQCHSIFMHQQIEYIVNAILTNCKWIKHVYDKSNASLPERYAIKQEDKFLIGEKKMCEILENENKFQIDFAESQKTGFFLDQRDNRKLLNQYSPGKKILNLYCYTGGFSIYALNNGAISVLSIDASKKAIETLDLNVSKVINPERHKSLKADVNQYLKSIEKDLYNLIIVDPPAFAKSIRKRHNAVQAYKRINKQVFEIIEKGGIVFTFSCSQVMDQELFNNTIRAAAIEANRSIRILHFLSQGSDHPISLFHPEGRYLKGLVLIIN